jgi:hypothetical protein
MVEFVASLWKLYKRRVIIANSFGTHMKYRMYRAPVVVETSWVVMRK